MQGWKQILHANGNQNKTGVAILISYKMHFIIQTVTRDKEGYYIMTKESIQAGDKTIINMYLSNIKTPQYIRQMLIILKMET